MIIKITQYVEVDEKEYSKLTKKEIREIAKSIGEAGDVTDYINDMAKSELSNANYNK